MNPLCLFERVGHVAILTLNRPEAANALSRALVAELATRLAEAAADKELRALVVTGAGDRVFCAGADLKERREMAPEEVPLFLQKGRELMDGLAALRCPTIAAFNGAAMGGGLELALCCDLRLAARGVKLGLTETSLAILPGAGGTQRLPRLVGVARAKELILTARRVDADEAWRIGLVNEVVEPGTLRARALAVAQEIASNGPVAVAQAKKAIDGGIELSLSEALAFEQECYAPTLETEDRWEALNAFVEKRKPVFKGC
ncbi:MAG: enoyl-CoA hydratase-related protein [Pseudomonadota bacterium]